MENMKYLLKCSEDYDRLYYNEILIQFINSTDHLLFSAELLIKNLAQMQKKINFSFVVCSARNYSVRFMYRHKIDLLLYIDKRKRIHYFVFSHVLMDGIAFMLFCKDFYSLNGITVKEKDKESNATSRSCNIFKIFSLANFLKMKSEIVSKKGESNQIIINTTFKKFRTKSFNQTICKILEENCHELGLISTEEKLRIGVPINICGLQSRKNYGNYIVIVPDNADLDFSKNYFVVTLLTVLLRWFPIRLFDKSFICKFVDFCFNQVDIVYSNLDARHVDSAPIKIIYSAPVFQNKLFTFSCITHNENVNIIIKSLLLSNNQLVNFKKLFKQKYYQTE